METNGLIQKVVKAGLEVGGKLSADKKNKEQNYDYLSSDKILSICGQALFSQGVVVMPNIKAQEVTMYEYTDQYGKTKKRYDSRVDFAFVLSDGLSVQELNWYGMGSDYTVPDKALYKAITSGHKYFLMKLLCIGAGNEDGEHDNNDSNEDGKKPTQPQKATTLPLPPAADKPDVVSAHKALQDNWTYEKLTFVLGSTVRESDKKGVPGKLYIDLDNDTLIGKQEGLLKLKGKNGMTPEQYADVDLKLATIAGVLVTRAKIAEVKE